VARAAVRRRLSWLEAEAVGLVEEAPGVRSIELEVPGWPGHLPGQHVDVRLTAEDGYQAQRSYSIATPAAGERVTLTVELVPDGEVSIYLVGELRIGDEFELRGPIGGYFVWRPALGSPLLLIGAGSGIVPLMAIVRHRVGSGDPTPIRLLLSSRSWGDVIYREELEALRHTADGVEIVHTLTRSRPPDWTGYDRRVDAAMISEVAQPSAERPLCFVCGPTGFVEAAANALVALGYDPATIKTERFGPSGGGAS
jgi:ferredoxin-NADP reductase